MIETRVLGRATIDKMEKPNRLLRSNAPSSNLPLTSSVTIRSPVVFKAASPSSNDSDINIIRPGSKLPGLSSAELSLLHRKQKKLAATAPSTLLSLTAGPHSINALNSSPIFAQDLAGSAVCVDPAGWILTCAHCFAESEEDFQTDSKRRWLLYYTGLAVQAECCFWDMKRDLALCKIVAIETADTGESRYIPTFRYVRLASSLPKVKTPIICIGQPGSEDLESATVRKTKYNLVEVSAGTFRGLVRGANPQDNSEIGTLMHDAWTYWGHSGAPLLKAADGTLLGLHSSWDSTTGMRHGVPLVAIEEFLRQYLPSAVDPQAHIPVASGEQDHSRIKGSLTDSLQHQILA